MMDQTLLLLKHGLLEIEAGSINTPKERISPALATVIANFYYYGYGVSKAIYEDLLTLDPEELTAFWHQVEPALLEYTLDNREVAEYVVYQNFPEEVLNMDQATYWTKQILMYFGFDKELFREEKQDRPALIYDKAPKVLHKATPRSLANIANNLLNKPAKWISEEEQTLEWLIDENIIQSLDDIPFKENLITAGLLFMKKNQSFRLKTMTDVLRFIVGLSEGDISLKTNSKVKSFKRAERRFLLQLISEVNDMEEGVMRHKNKWLKVFHSLHVGDYSKLFPKVYEVAQTLRNEGGFETFNAKIERLLAADSPEVLAELQKRPGDFARRLIHCLELFGEQAVTAFQAVIQELPSFNLLRLKAFLQHYPERRYRAIAPKGNWTKLQILTSIKDIPEQLLAQVAKAIQQEISNRIGDLQIQLDPRTQWIKLPSNNADAVLPYGRGTIFPIPKKIKFIRTATFWRAPNKGTVWFDNGWNFFGSDWKAIGTCCWNVTNEMLPAAVFSGDPVSGTNVGGKAAQLIDLYPDQLLKKGVRYAVWNILCYSRIPFSGVEEVLGILEMGKNPNEGKLVEPSRATFAFPVTGDSLTKYICFIDLQTRQLVYLDANLKGHVNSAKSNENNLAEQMPAIQDYLNSWPSVHDIFEKQEQSNEAHFKVLYDDEQQEVKQGFVFQPKNEDNDFENWAINDLIDISADQVKPLKEEKTD